MSYCRWGDDSDVYVFYDGCGWHLQTFGAAHYYNTLGEFKIALKSTWRPA